MQATVASYEEGGPGNPEFCFCEINPRCAHTFNFGYKYATGHNLFKDVFECVLNNKKPDSTPWDFWAKGESKICVEVLVNVKGSAGKRMDEVVDTAYVAKLEAHPDCKLIRHIKKDDYVLTEEDAVSAAGTTLLQIWIVCSTNEEAAAKEIGMRKNLYLIKQNDEYPEFWTELASKYTGDLGICTPTGQASAGAASTGKPRLGLLPPQVRHPPPPIRHSQADSDILAYRAHPSGMLHAVHLVSA